MVKEFLLADLLQRIAANGWSLTGRLRPGKAGNSNFGMLCEALLSGRGEVSGMAIAEEILSLWQHADERQKLDHLTLLAERFGPEPQKLDAAIEDYCREKSPRSAAALHAAAESRRQELMRRLNTAPGATLILIEMRTDILKLAAERPELRVVDSDLYHLVTSWFNKGFLVLKRIDWDTSASILEKIIRYEAVHEIRSWSDLRQRLAPSDRRCFAFFHPRLGDEPLIFVEVALTREVPTDIDAVLADGRVELAADEATTAIFYSISNCQIGLRGVSFGNFLLKQVIEQLRTELPKLTEFLTLSPVPGFAGWLRTLERADANRDLRDLLVLLKTADWPQDAKAAEATRKMLLPLAAHYFLNAKDRHGLPLDPVARFHLGNGALLDRLNFLADRSPHAMRSAQGLMVNYRYRLDELEKNHEAFAGNGTVVTVPTIRRLAETAAPFLQRNEQLTQNA